MVLVFWERERKGEECLSVLKIFILLSNYVGGSRLQCLSLYLICTEVLLRQPNPLFLLIMFYPPVMWRYSVDIAWNSLGIRNLSLPFFSPFLSSSPPAPAWTPHIFVQELQRREGRKKKRGANIFCGYLQTSLSPSLSSPDDEISLTLYVTVYDKKLYGTVTKGYARCNE